MTVEDGETTNRVVEVEFQVDDPRYPLVAVSQRTGCRASLQQILPRSDGTYTVFYRVSDVDPVRVLDVANEDDRLEARLIGASEKEGILEVDVSNVEEFFVVTLTDAGAIPKHMWSANGVAHIVADIPPNRSASDVIDRFSSDHPAVEIVARRQKEYTTPLFSHRELQMAMNKTLTTRQHEALLAAYAGGYFDWPRKKSGEEVAAELGVSSPTFFQHLRRAEQKVLSLLFTEQRTGANRAETNEDAISG
ncbi:bacterio-opsin activator domain-containing protein [Haladaptatus sp. T7]|uniref:bacterio-opsin activator domain-containing protein n=1 Tax=Haladaptatus sp. T7 TaxID=2029368 RepID=UPI0022328EDA|nr:bacterio-opsin activator domain-containing protein [Haladaptatus sp. T7]